MELTFHMGVSAIVQTQNLSKTYGAINCVNKVDLHVQEGKSTDFWVQTEQGKQLR